MFRKLCLVGLVFSLICSGGCTSAENTNGLEAKDVQQPVQVNQADQEDLVEQDEPVAQLAAPTDPEPASLAQDEAAEAGQLPEREAERQKIIELYREVLEDPEAQFDADDPYGLLATYEPVHHYSYDLIHLNDDEYPELILMANCLDEPYLVLGRLFAYNPETMTLENLQVEDEHTSSPIFQFGTELMRPAPASYRYFPGLCTKYASRMQGLVYETRYYLTADGLQQDAYEPFRADARIPDPAFDTDDIEGTPIDDLSTLEQLTLAPPSYPEIPLVSFDPSEADFVHTFYGTVRIMSGTELMDYIGEDNAHFRDQFGSFYYIVLIFDAPQMVEAYSYGNQSLKAGEGTMLVLASSHQGNIYEDVSYLDGRRLLIECESGAGWPSDARIPLGEPVAASEGSLDIEILKALDLE